tara:strand:- start:4024 stop:5724 length:1701 start_codon:yes stop_codon:yes gene_type:complete
MSIFKKHLKIIGQILFVTLFIFFSTLQAKSADKYNKAENISDYFSGVLLLNQSKYKESYKHLRKLDGLEQSHLAFSSKYLYSLVNSGNFKQAYNFSKKLEKEKQDSFETDLIIGIYHLKNSKFNISNQYFLKAKNRKSIPIMDNYIAETLYVWSNLKNDKLENSKLKLDQLDSRFINLKKIQNAFLHCFYNSQSTDFHFESLISGDQTDFSRYNYFHAKYLYSIGLKNKASKVIDASLKKNPRNLLLNQYKNDLVKLNNSFEFNCKKESHVIAELLYITANALSSQSIYYLSNFYLNLSKYLNEDFHAYDTLLAENFYNIGDLTTAKKIYKRLLSYGSAFKWFSNKQISRILIQEEKKLESLNLLKSSYSQLPDKGIYETFDYAEFLKNNEEFEKSITFYTDVLKKIDKSHPLFPEVTDGRGVAYERTGQWNKAEKDLLASLEVSPNQAYVINYLAYSWIEKGIKIEKSLEMLENANKLKSNDPFIIDSLGWALFKLKKYKEAKKYLQLAVRLMPADPIVNDHYGDALWKNGNEIQARYYWYYVLNLEKAEKDLKKIIEKKLIKGL